MKRRHKRNGENKMGKSKQPQYKVSVSRVDEYAGTYTMYEGPDMSKAFVTFFDYSTPARTSYRFIRLFKNGVQCYETTPDAPLSLEDFFAALENLRQSDKYASLAAMKRANKEIGHYWFENPSSFNSFVYPKVYGGRYVVESTWRKAYSDEDEKPKGEKIFTYHVWECVGGKMNCVKSGAEHPELNSFEAMDKVAFELGKLTIA
jgi:hypothetical protein